MCGRYFINTLPQTLAEQFLVQPPTDHASSFNIAPTQNCAIVKTNDDGQRELIHARWGLIPFWAKDRKMASRTINARLETAKEKPAYRAAWKRRRCVVPASGYYEWVGRGKSKTPYAVLPTQAELLALAGLWESWTDDIDGEMVHSFTLMTTEAVGPAADIHHRMPLMLDPELQQAWLSHALEDPVGIASLVAEAQPTQTVKPHAVSTAVNSVHNNYPELLEPAQLI
ncbi:MAG: SOS response-associated peptidase [Lysobacterales bacterium]